MTEQSNSDPFTALATPEALFDLVVVPNCREYATDEDDLRLAMNLIISLQCLRDGMLAAHAGTARVGHARTTSEYQRHLETIEPEFGALADAANAAKHFLTRPVRDHDSRLGWDAFRVGDPCGLSLSPLKVMRPGNQRLAVVTIVCAAMRYWRRELDRPAS